MNLFDEIKAKADANGDGALTLDDLSELQQNHPELGAQLDQLKQQADANGDGKIDFNDIGNFLQGLQGTQGDVLGKIGELFRR